MSLVARLSLSAQCVVRVLFDATWSDEKIANTVAVAAQVAGMEGDGEWEEAEEGEKPKQEGVEDEEEVAGGVEVVSIADVQDSDWVKQVMVRTSSLFILN